MKNKLQKLLGVIALAYRFLENNILFGNITKYLVGGKFKKPTNTPELIDINTIDIGNLKTIDDVLDYVNQVGKERFTNGSIEILLKRIDDHLIDTNKMDISNINSMDDILDYVSSVGMDKLTNERIDILKQRVIDKIYPKKYIKRRKFLFFYKTVRLYCPYDDDLPKGHSYFPKIEKKI